ncbi:MAG: HK97 gp10 family phage protein [Candidatus Methanoculleus thermohydrogenotrophicum]|nr:HK97 gp10 family phage protein [Candidatus Methanoculleus thermohydrogenotrophicum]
MTDPGVHVIGAEDLAKAFSKLADDIKGPALEAATRAAALPVLNQVRITVPEGGRTPYKTGTYRRSFHMETVEKSSERCTVIVGTDAPQARRLEYGFVGPDKLGRVYNQAARPHIRPALDENRGTAVAEFRAAIGDIIRRRG